MSYGQMICQPKGTRQSISLRVCMAVLALAAILGGWPVTTLHSQENDKPGKSADKSTDEVQSPDQTKDQPKKNKGEKKEAKKRRAEQLPAVLWRDCGDIASLDLVNGAGGPAHAPTPNADYTFIKEDMNGTSPKFYARDTNGVEWLVKMGVEAKPETAATRLVWAMGYFADEDYFLPRIHVNAMEKLHHKMSGADLKTGVVENVRLKRQGPESKKLENWSWVNNPFRGTREFNGLLVMMALTNNWDLKEVNNKVYVADHERHYVVSDLGAAFGKTGWPAHPPLPHATKGNLKDYQNSKFIDGVHGDTVKFEMNIGAPFFIKDFSHKFFKEYSQNRRLENSVPIEDVRWIAGELAHLTPQQIRDAFRTAGYEPEEVEGYAKVVEQRIMQLNHLDESLEGRRGAS
jgi:hypothetical protein